MKRTLIIAALLAGALRLQAGTTNTLEKHVPTKPGQHIVVNGISGSKVIFRSWAKDEVYVHLTVSISSSDEEYEKAYVASVAIDDLQTGDDVHLTLRDGDPDRKKGSWFSRLFGQFFVNKEISGEVYVPQKNALTTDMKYGSLTLDGMSGEVQLLGTTNSVILRNCASVGRVENNYGTTRIESSGGALRLTGSSSKVSVSDFDGGVDIDANYSTVTVSHVAHDVAVTDQSGKITLDDVGGNATLDVNYSSVTLNRLKGAADVQCGSGTVRIRDVGAADVRAKYSTIDIANVRGIGGKELLVTSQSGRLTLEDVVGDVVIDNPYSPMTLTRIAGNVSLTSTSSTVEASEVTGDWKSQTQYSTITLRQLAAKSVSITNSSGALKVAMTSVPATLTVQNAYGDVRVSMPAGYAGDVDLDAEYGTVETSLPVKVKVRSGSGSASGKVGSGTGSISIETKSGNIDLEEK